MQKDQPYEKIVVQSPEERNILVRLRQLATAELSRHDLSDTAWRRAMEKANYNDVRARSFYVDYRVEEMRRENPDIGKPKDDARTREQREKSKYENAVFLLLIVVCLVIAIIFGGLLVP